MRRFRVSLTGRKLQRFSRYAGQLAMWSMVAFLGLNCLALASTASFAAASKSNRIRIEYVSPTDASHQLVYEQLKQARVLEYVQALMQSLRLPKPLLFKLTGCNGMSNAWYHDDTVAVCYEFVDDILKNAADRPLPVGITRLDTIVGPLLDAFLHEAGHAVFAYLGIPIFGREEDAADQFSAYIMLQHDKDKARRLLLGSAYQYKMDMKDPEQTLSIKSFSDEHGLPAQRFFNVLCIAYGANPKLFSEIVEKQYLPQSRAESCQVDYQQVRFAFQTLISPHVDKRAARRFFKTRRAKSH